MPHRVPAEYALIPPYHTHPASSASVYNRYTAGMHDVFRRLAHATSEKLGSPWAFTIALSVIALWALSGPFLNFSTTWQLFINTMTTILTFLMVFLIQNTQNRDTRAIHLKLDDLILYTKGTDNQLIDLENLTDEQIDQLEKQYHSLAKALGKDGVPHSPEDHAGSVQPPEPAKSTPER
jgi:low affinity Fe/Cu permease